MESAHSLKSLFFRIVLVVGYSVFGGGIFYILEQDRGSSEAIKQADDHYNKTMRDILKRCTLNETDLELILNEIRDTFLPHTRPVSWTFTSGMDIALSAITTIGYGTTVPKTLAGRWFLIFYATVGIPLMAMMLTTIGEKTKHLIRLSIVLFERKAFGNNQPRNVNKKSLLVVVLVTSALLHTAAAISTVLQKDDWDFSLAIYAWFVTLTTIGFGDHIPSSSGNAAMVPVEMIYFTLVTFLGLSLIAAIFHTVSDWADNTKALTKKSVKKSIGRFTGSLSTNKEESEISETNKNTGFTINMSEVR